MFYTNPLSEIIDETFKEIFKVKTGCSPQYCHHLLQLKQFRFSHHFGSMNIYLDLY